MPPTRRPLQALGSLRLVKYANNPTRVITELAFIADARVNALEEGDRSDVLEVQFEEFMDGVNSRGKGTKTKQRKMTVEQAAAVLLVTVQKGHVELTTKNNDPHTIDTIKILPEAKRILAAFLPKLRGYGDIPYDQQYRGALALAKRHFFPKGNPPTKKELMALLLQSYQQRRELSLKCRPPPQPTKTLGIQTSLETVDGLTYTGTASSENTPGRRVHLAIRTDTMKLTVEPNSQSRDEPPNNNNVAGIGPTLTASGVNPVDEHHDSVSDPESEPLQRTPVAPRCFNPYMTPVSNPRHVDHMAATPSPHMSPSPATSHLTEITPDEDGQTAEGIGELLQVTATSQGVLSYYYSKFTAACHKITFLKDQKEAIQREFDLTKKKLDETEQRLREANVDRRKLKDWGNSLHRRVESICKQLDVLRNMTIPESTDNEGSVDDLGPQERFDPTSI